jgi:hypothetical protein
MAGLRFTRSEDGIHRASFNMRFRAGIDTLETAIVFAFEHVTPDAALPEIQALDKERVSALTIELFQAKGYGVEFIGENTAPEIIAAATEKVRELFPKLADETP